LGKSNENHSSDRKNYVNFYGYFYGHSEIGMLNYQRATTITIEIISWAKGIKNPDLCRVSGLMIGRGSYQFPHN
jgi:hypothetical protein